MNLPDPTKVTVIKPGVISFSNAVANPPSTTFSAYGDPNRPASIDLFSKATGISALPIFNIVTSKIVTPPRSRAFAAKYSLPLPGPPATATVFPFRSAIVFIVPSSMRSLRTRKIVGLLVKGSSALGAMIRRSEPDAQPFHSDATIATPPTSLKIVLLVLAALTVGNSPL